MRVLFVHQNFPGQFRHLAPALAAQGHEVLALTLNLKKARNWQGVKVLPYVIRDKTATGLHPFLSDFEVKFTRGNAAFQAMQELDRRGFQPDIVVAHPGWGESLFVKDVWPEARLGLYSELYHLNDDRFCGFDPEFYTPLGQAEAIRLRLRNLNNRLHMETADAALSPTRFQAATYPDAFQKRISVIHDGIDADLVLPNADATFAVSEGQTLTRQDEVITFVNRNLEPYRGYHMFMRALPALLEQRETAQIVIIGGDKTGYGAAAPDGKSWKQVFIDEVRAQITDANWARVHFVGRVSYDRYLAALQVARVHVYLTYPFVLSWSLLEAMSAGAAIVASDTAPVREVMCDGATGRMVDFFDHQALTKTVCELLDNP
ncbi:MAG TPA: glycosyltransferase, partial [Aliiroseovarius sp.]|nr:glycosyltransferase [Aliiroseovarius sp.]